MRIFLILLAAIVLLTGAWTVIMFKTAGHSWEASHDCGDRGTLSDSEFITAAIAQSIRASENSPYFIQTSRRTSNYKFAPEFLMRHPDCCSIYRGFPNDYFSPETFEQYMTRTFAKVVKINFMKENIVNGAYVGRLTSHYVKLDACANQLD
ncbi:hypothetical protein JOH50_003092 [Rhizobium leguminosarum]|nr:hypothetical protein [Rhizobium leguminosarum]